MLKIFFNVLIIIVFFNISGYAGLTNDSLIIGNWVGTLDVQTTKLRIVFKISKNENNQLVVFLDSPDQGVQNIPTSKVSFEGGKLIVDVASIRGNFTGEFNEKERTIIGVWKQMNYEFPLVLKAMEKPISLNRLQEPKPPFPYDIEEVEIENTEAGIKLSGTFISPKDDNQKMAVILITGSGPQNRDEELLGHKPFLVIADYLTRRGISVLRYDDRGVGKSTGDFSKSTIFDFASDVKAAVNYLKSRKDVSQIGLIGHSEGGVIAPIVANKDKDIKFIVSLAGPALSGEELLLLQLEEIQKSSGVPEEDIKRELSRNKELFALLKTEQDEEKFIIKGLEIFKKYSDLQNDTVNTQQNLDDQYKMQLKQISSLWFRSFLVYDPENDLKQLKQPIFVLIGEKDLQVPVKQNFERYEKIFKSAGKKNFKLMEMKNLNHLFQNAETGNPAEYSKIEETFSEKALDEILSWIKVITK